MSKQNKPKEIHIPKAENMRLSAKDKQLINCLDAIEKASQKGKLSCYLLSDEKYYLIKENEKKLLEAGYDLIKSHFSHAKIYFLEAVWDESATGIIRQEND